eukprot:8962919-Alexandrium_andersonii.AAC.1
MSRGIFNSASSHLVICPHRPGTAARARVACMCVCAHRAKTAKETHGMERTRTHLLESAQACDAPRWNGAAPLGMNGAEHGDEGR